MRKTVIKVFALCLMMMFAATNAYASEKSMADTGKITCLKDKASKKEYKNPEKYRDEEDDDDEDEDRYEERNKHENKAKHEKKKSDDKKQKGNKKPAYAAVTGITINKTSTTIGVGSWERLSAGVLPTNATDKKFFWFSDNPRVAWVNPSGKVTGARAGTAVIYAVTRDGFKTASCTVTVSGTPTTDRVVTGVSLNKTALTLNVGAGERLTATVNPGNAYNKAVTWSSSDSSVATVDRYGYVYGVKTGTVVVTVRTNDGGKTAACNVTISNNGTVVPVTSVSIVRNESYIALKEGASKRLSVKVLPDNASDKDVTWTTSDAGIVTVDSNGYITGVNDGTATITVTTDDGRRTDTCRVEVISTSQWVSVTGVRVNLINTTIPVGFTDRIRYEVTPANASDEEVQWSSSNTDVAAVDAYGSVEAKRTGTAVITATTLDGDKTASTFIVVVPAVDKPSHGILLNKMAITLVDGDTDNLTVLFYPANENNYSLTWTSSNTNVATVNQNGRVTAEGPGTAIITVRTSNNWSASYTVTVI